MFKPLLSATIGLLCFATSSLAQYVVYKSKDGVVLLCKDKEIAFTLDIKGDNIKPIRQDTAPHPYFMVDGRFLQVMPVVLSAFKGDKAAGDEAILKQHCQQEVEFFKKTLEEVHAESKQLPSGQAAMFWSFVPEQAPKEQVFMSFHPKDKDYVMVLGSAVDGNDTKEAVQKFLTGIAQTYYGSDHALTLKFLPDGTYQRE